jgi:hypothetical protein
MAQAVGQTAFGRFVGDGRWISVLLGAGVIGSLAEKKAAEIGSAAFARSCDQVTLQRVTQPRVPADGRGADGRNGVSRVIGRAGREDAAFEIIDDAAGTRGHDGIAGFLLLFEGPLLHRTVDLAEVIHARILLRGAAGFDEVGNGDGREETDDRDDDHDFDEGKA